MAEGIHRSKISSGDLRKCGEISAFLSVGKEEFYLSCGFCELLFLQLNCFIQHLYVDHFIEFPKYLSKEAANIPLYSKETLDDFDLDNNFEANLNDLDCLASGEESVDVDFLSNDFESSLWDTSGPDNRELSQSCVRKENIQTKKRTRPYKADVDMMVSDSEIVQEEQDLNINKEHLSDKQNPNEADETEEDNKIATDKNKKNSKLITKKIKVKDTILDTSQITILATMYKEYKCLWDETDIAYRFKNRRDEAFKYLHTDFNNKTGLILSRYDFEREVMRFRKICSYEKRQKIKCKQNKEDLKTPSLCSYYEYIEFLERDVPPFECSICGQLYPALGKLKVHVASHDGSLPFKCHICGHAFQLGNNLTIHLRRHAQDFIYRCEVCNKNCATSTEKKSHMRTHTGEKPFICCICGSKWVTSSQLLAHTNTHEKRRQYKCEICPKTFYSSGVLKEHRSTHSKVRDNICDVCDKGFKSKKHLKQHKLIHESERKYACKVCGKRFAQAAGLCGHMKSHNTILATKPDIS